MSKLLKPPGKINDHNVRLQPYDSRPFEVNYTNDACVIKKDFGNFPEGIQYNEFGIFCIFDDTKINWPERKYTSDSIGYHKSTSVTELIPNKLVHTISIYLDTEYGFHYGFQCQTPGCVTDERKCPYLFQLAKVDFDYDYYCNDSDDDSDDSDDDSDDSDDDSDDSGNDSDDSDDDSDDSDDDSDDSDDDDSTLDAMIVLLVQNGFHYRKIYNESGICTYFRKQTHMNPNLCNEFILLF